MFRILAEHLKVLRQTWQILVWHFTLDFGPMMDGRLLYTLFKKSGVVFIPLLQTPYLNCLHLEWL